MAATKPTVHVYIGFVQNANPDAWVLGTGALGVTTYLGAPLIYDYTDVGADVRALSTQTGKPRGNARDTYQTGTARIVLDNRAGDYDPLNLTGTYVSGGVTLVKPGKPVYVTLEYGGVEYTVFTGRIREWQPDFEGHFDSTATILLWDVMAELNTTDVDVTTTASDTGTNAAEVLVAAGSFPFTFSTGATVTQAMTFDGSALAALRTLEQSEQGALYIDVDGQVVFSARSDVMTQARSMNVQATFTGSGTLQHTGKPVIAYESDIIRNTVKATRQGGAEQTGTNSTSVDAYGVKRYSLTGLAQATDGAALDLAQYLADRYGEPYARITEVTLKPMTNDSLMVQSLTRRIRDRIAVEFTTKYGTTISQEAMIIGVKHDFDQSGDMTTRFALESAQPFSGWRLGYSALGVDTVLTF